VRLGLVLAAVGALGGCSSVATTGGGTVTTTVPVAAAPASFSNDIASALVVFDIPTTLEPIEGASVVLLKLSSGGESRAIDAHLVRADADGAMAALPPPAADRNYYLFGFSPTDQQHLRDAQAWSKARPAGSVAIQFELQPELCTTDTIDPALTRYSIFAVLSGNTVAPLTSNALITDLVETRQRPLPACAGHSG
jgi:hypothetical protein